MHYYDRQSIISRHLSTIHRLVVRHTNAEFIWSKPCHALTFNIAIKFTVTYRHQDDILYVSSIYFS